MGGFDINNFKNAFLNAISNASNLETNDNIINTDKEAVEANKQLSIFKNELKNITNPIGDSLDISKTNNKEVSTDELLAYVDPKIAAKVKNYIETKPVETIKAGKTPKLASRMAEMTENLDIDKLNAFLDMAYNSDVADRIENDRIVADLNLTSPADLNTANFLKYHADIIWS